MNRTSVVTLLAGLRNLSVRGRLVCWLLMFISAYRLGLPVLFGAALSGLPWLLLSPPVDNPPRRVKE